MHKKTFIYAVILLLLFSVFFRLFALSVNADAPPKKDCPPSYVGQTKYFYYVPEGDNNKNKLYKCEDGKAKEVKKKNKTIKRKVKIPKSGIDVAVTAVLTLALMNSDVNALHEAFHDKWREMDEWWYDEIYSTSYIDVFHEKILNWSDLVSDLILPKIRDDFYELPDLDKVPVLRDKLRELLDTGWKILDMSPLYYKKINVTSLGRSYTQYIVGFEYITERPLGISVYEMYTKAETNLLSPEDSLPNYVYPYVRNGFAYDPIDLEDAKRRIRSVDRKDFDIHYFYDRVREMMEHEFYEPSLDRLGIKNRNFKTEHTSIEIPTEIPVINIPDVEYVRIVEIDNDLYTEVEYSESKNNTKIGVIPIEPEFDENDRPQPIPVLPTKPESDPSPNPNPNPNPDPEPSPDPSPDPSPEPSPDPSPEPVKPPNTTLPNDGESCGELDLDLKSIDLFTTKFPFSLPWDIFNAIEAIFGDIGSSTPEFHFILLGEEIEIKIPEFILKSQKFVHSILIIIFDVSLVYALHRWFGGAS